jgi:hypothetical protein
MRVPNATAASSGRRRIGAICGPLLIIVLALGGSMAGCSSGGDMTADNASAGSPMAAAAGAGPVIPLGHMHMPTAEEVRATWAARPAYVRALPADWQSAYAYALARPDVLQWLPCYCGCTAMDHRSNLDCFFQRREIPGSYVYEEHASFCDVCVNTANLAQQLLREGKTIVQVRAAVDARFGGLAPGTDTPLPPAS